MEYIPGKDLRAIQSRVAGVGTVPADPLVLHVTTRLCQALDYAHRQTSADGRRSGSSTAT